MLFVPAVNPRWIEGAVATGTDSLILDLEDSVAPSRKVEARANLKAMVETAKSARPEIVVVVRINGHDTDHWPADLEAVVAADVDALYLPKITTAQEVTEVSQVLDFLERREGRSTRIRLFVALETAASVRNCDAIAEAHGRVAGLVGATARDADVSRSIGFRWTQGGLETLYLRSKTVIAARAANGVQPVGGLWQDVQDLDGLAAFAKANRELGFSGLIVIHPSHVPIVNQAMTISDAEAAYFKGLVEAFDDALERGLAAVPYEGEMIDVAHAVTARALLEQYASLQS